MPIRSLISESQRGGRVSVIEAGGLGSEAEVLEEKRGLMARKEGLTERFKLEADLRQGSFDGGIASPRGYLAAQLHQQCISSWPRTAF